MTVLVLAGVDADADEDEDEDDDGDEDEDDADSCLNPSEELGSFPPPGRILQCWRDLGILDVCMVVNTRFLA